MSDPDKLLRMHTAEHILSAVMRKHFDAPRNLEFHLNEKKTKCDYEIPRPITDSDITKIEEMVNQQIAEDHNVTSFKLSVSEAGDYDLWKVPADADTIRIVKISDFDAQPCRGGHVESTKKIGRFSISSYEMRENSRIRIRFKVS